MGVASLVLGIIALAIGLFSGGSLGWAGSILAILGIIFGVLGKKDSSQAKQAKAGLILSIIALCLGLILFIACTACVGAGISALGGLSELENYF